MEAEHAREEDLQGPLSRTWRNAWDVGVVESSVPSTTVDLVGDERKSGPEGRLLPKGGSGLPARLLLVQTSRLLLVHPCACFREQARMVGAGAKMQDIGDFGRKA